MLMSLRDKENSYNMKTEHEVIKKIDKTTLGHSRNTNRLTLIDTIQRFNMRQTHQISIPR